MKRGGMKRHESMRERERIYSIRFCLILFRLLSVNIEQTHITLIGHILFNDYLTLIFLNACSMSAMRSSTSSIPTLILMRVSVIPNFSRSSFDNEAWEVSAGKVRIVSHPPRLPACWMIYNFLSSLRIPFKKKQQINPNRRRRKISFLNLQMFDPL